MPTRLVFCNDDCFRCDTESELRRTRFLRNRRPPYWFFLHAVAKTSHPHRADFATQAIRLRQRGEQGIMGAVAASVSDSLTKVLRWAFCWNSFEELPENVTAENVLAELNTDFGTSGLLAADLVAVVHAWQCGAMSQVSMLDLFRKSEVLPEGRSNVEEAALIAAKPPLVPVAPKAGPGIAGGQEILPVGPARGGGDRGGLGN